MNEFNFGGNLKIVRLSKGISQETMALALEIAQSTYSRIERSAAVPAPEMVEKITNLLEVEVSMLLSGRELSDLIPKIEFEQQVKSIMNTTMGVVFYWVLMVPFISATYDIGYGFWKGFTSITGGTEEARHTAGMVTFIAGILFIYFWMKKVQK